jgi:hypothetical protein
MNAFSIFVIVFAPFLLVSHKLYRQLNPVLCIIQADKSKKKQGNTGTLTISISYTSNFFSDYLIWQGDTLQEGLY